MHTHPRTLASMATSHRHPPPPPPRPPTQSQARPLDLDATIVSAKHLKNVNWRTGDLKPYVVFWSDPDFKLFTKPDESGSNRPVWNERFTLPLNSGPTSYFYLDVFHAESPNPLVGSLRISLSDLPDPDDGVRIRNFELTRPSGRPQGKIRIKLCVKERNLQQHNYDFTPLNSYFCVPATAPLPPRDYRHAPPPSPPPALSPPPPPPPRPPREYTYAHPPPPPPASVTSYGSYHGAYSAPPSPYFYSGFYSSAPPLPLGPLLDQTAPPLPSKPSFDQTVSGGFYSVPSAPVEHTYEERQRGGGGSGRFGVGVGTRSSVGAVTGRVGGLALDEGVTYEHDNVVPRESHSGRASEYGDYHRSNY